MLLVTGGAGFIGSHLVAAALAAGHRVRVLDDLSTGDKERVPDEAELLVGDVAHPDDADAAVEDVTAVVHLAAMRAVPRSVARPLDADRANTHGTLSILDAARRAEVGRVVLASSSSVYGTAAALPTPETTTPLPASPYAVSKLAGEHYARVYADLHGLSTLSLRFFNVYGPGQSPDGPYAQLVPRALEARRTGRRPVVYGDGLQSRDLVFVDDVVAAVLAAVDRPQATGVLNLGSGRAHTVLEVLAAVGTPPPVHLAPRPGDVPHTCADTTAITAALGWAPTTTLAEGLGALTR